MNKLLLILLGGLLVLTGCSHGYVLTLNNGSHVRAASKPRLERGFYYFKDAQGNDAEPVFAGSVRELSPASMVSDDRPKFQASPAR